MKYLTPEIVVSHYNMRFDRVWKDKDALKRLFDFKLANSAGDKKQNTSQENTNRIGEKDVPYQSTGNIFNSPASARSTVHNQDFLNQSRQIKETGPRHKSTNRFSEFKARSSNTLSYLNPSFPVSKNAHRSLPRLELKATLSPLLGKLKEHHIHGGASQRTSVPRQWPVEIRQSQIDLSSRRFTSPGHVAETLPVQSELLRKRYNVVQYQGKIHIHIRDYFISGKEKQSLMKKMENYCNENIGSEVVVLFNGKNVFANGVLSCQ